MPAKMKPKQKTAPKLREWVRWMHLNRRGVLVEGVAWKTKRSANWGLHFRPAIRVRIIEESSHA